MKKRTKGILIASAVAATLVVSACTQRVPTPGSVSMAKSANKCSVHKCKANHCKANHCKANQCKANKK